MADHNLRQTDSFQRSFFKALSWRFFGTIDTILLSFLVIGWIAPWLGGRESEPDIGTAIAASSIAIAELVTKIVLYTLHERVWNWIRWGKDRPNGLAGRRRKRAEKRRRSLVKTASWRILASLDTTLLALIFTGSPSAAVTIGILEIFTKLMLYYFHERLWLRIPLR